MKTMNPKNVYGWVVAGGCSLGLHLVVVLCFTLFGNGAPKPIDPAVAQSTVEPAAPAENPNAPAVDEPVAPPVDLDPAAPPSRVAPRPGNRASGTAAANPRASSRSAARSPAARPADSASAGDAPIKTKSYTVKPGDNLTHLARRCGSTPDEIAKLNGVDVKKMADLKVGQTIKIKDNE